ncbi:MAG: hypothetical protein WC683_18165 [bacterium]
MDEKTLYPVNYEEPKAETKPAVGRDEAAALALIRAAVPAGGKPLPVAQVRKLVCGDQPQYAIVAQGPDPSKAMAEAIEAVAVGQPVIGPAATAGFLPEEVDTLVQQVIEERKPSWKPAAVEAAGLGEVGLGGEEKPR